MTLLIATILAYLPFLIWMICAWVKEWRDQDDLKYRHKHNGE